MVFIDYQEKRVYSLEAFKYLLDESNIIFHKHSKILKSSVFLLHKLEWITKIPR